MQSKALILTAIAVIWMTAGTVQADVRDDNSPVVDGTYTGDGLTLKGKKGKLRAACIALDDGTKIEITDGELEDSIAIWGEWLEKAKASRDRLCVIVKDDKIVDIERKPPKPAKAASPAVKSRQ